MASGRVNLQFPLAGIDRGLAFQGQPPYTTPRAINVRPRGQSTERMRGGSRPGTAKAYSDAVAAGYPVRLIDTYSSYRTDVSAVFNDAFTGTGALGDDWNRGTWGASPTPPTKAGGLVTVTNTTAGAVLDDVNPDLGRTMQVTLGGAAMPATHVGGIYYTIWAMLDDTNGPAAGACVYVSMWISISSAKVRMNVGSVVAGASAGASSYVEWDFVGSETHDLIFTVAGGTLFATWGTHTISYTPSALPTTDRFGFQIVSPSAAVSGVVTSFQVVYGATGAHSRGIVCSANGATKYTDANNALQTASGLALGSDQNIRSCERFGINYIADYGEYRATHDDGVTSNAGNAAAWANATAYKLWDKVVGTDSKDYYCKLAHTSETGVKGAPTTGTDYGTYWALAIDDFDSATYADWTTVASVGDFLWIYGATTAANIEMYRITAVSTGYVTIYGVFSVAEVGCSFRVIRGPKIFTPSPATGDQITSWSAAVATANAAATPVRIDADSMVPVGCPLVCAWNGRIVMAGGPVYPYAWWMSRWGDPLDWEYGAWDGDPARAFYSQASDQNVIGEPITALVGFVDDFLLIGCENSTWYMRGDPGLGGMLSLLSQKVGIIAAGAWCAGPEGQIIIWSRDGLYEISPGVSSVPVPVSKYKLPDELVDIDTSLYEPLLAMDMRYRGVHIYIHPRSGGVVSHWWMDWDQRSFYQVIHSEGHQTSALALAKDTGTGLSDVLLGCRDGYIRRYSSGSTTDDSTEFTSEIVIGPISLGGQAMNGFLRQLVAVMGASAGSVTCEVYVGDTPEAVYATIPGNALWSGTLVAGLNYTVSPNVRGGCAFLRLSATTEWEMEAITAFVTEGGRLRKS